MKKLVILISGTGSNMLAIVRAAQQKNWAKRFNASVVAVISNNPQAKGLAFAQENNIPTHVVDHRLFPDRHQFEAALQNQIEVYQPAFVVLAGFMRLLGEGFVRHYKDRLINIHPSLLPAFPGLNTHARAIEAGCQFAGATVHWVNEQVDDGKILAQAVVPILAQDTPESVAKRVLSQEHLLYPRTLEKLFSEAKPAA
jgi:phosphoribosylglycinamide formyltransferase-1